MLKKPLAIAAIASTAALAPVDAAAGDAGLGALLGASLGAAIGHGVDGRHGAVVGGFLGAVAGASIAADSHRHRAPAPIVVHYAPGPVHYAPRPVYRPAPVYYAPPAVVVRPRPVFVHHAGPLRPVYAGPVVTRRHHDHEGHGHRIGHDRHWR